MAEKEVVEETPKEVVEVKPKKKAKASNEVHKATMGETKAVGPKTESMKTMSNVYLGRSFKLKTMADKNRL